ncbi:MAG TPA: Hsp20/alpha crystallin family protein [Acidobacteriota bacterium]|nr:Hsp20/alpha crystallin family protein [Acidobacteriota bacterium]
MATEVKKPETGAELVPRGRVESLFDDFFSEMERFWSLPLLRRRSLFPLQTRDGWRPYVDVFEKEGKLVIKADLPGTKKEDVEVSVEEGNLIIRGERKEESEVDEANYYRMERFAGKFYRCMRLPEGVDPGSLRAEFKDGVLEVQVPMPAEEKKKAVKIDVQ